MLVWEARALCARARFMECANAADQRRYDSSFPAALFPPLCSVLLLQLCASVRV